jgi:fatty-acyl-CoA synthase
MIKKAGSNSVAGLTQSYVHGASDVPLIGDTIGVHFDRAAERWRERPALIVRHQNIRWTYGELKDRVDAFAGGLLALGIEPGDRIGIWSPNNAEWVITQFICDCEGGCDSRQHQSGLPDRRA